MKLKKIKKIENFLKIEEYLEFTKNRNLRMC